MRQQGRSPRGHDPVGADGYPGMVLSVGCPDAEAVRRLQRRLNRLGCGPVAVNGEFDAVHTAAAVRRFQARAVDLGDHPLRVDARVGVLTWGALFGPQSVPSRQVPATGLPAAVLEVATGRVGQAWPEAGQALDGESGGAAFTRACVATAARRLGCADPHPVVTTTAAHWRAAAAAAGARWLSAREAQDDPGRVQPGALFVIATGGGQVHTGIVARHHGGCLVTVEAPALPAAGEGGLAVACRRHRRLAQVNRGFMDLDLGNGAIA